LFTAARYCATGSAVELLTGGEDVVPFGELLDVQLTNAISAAHAAIAHNQRRFIAPSSAYSPANG